MNKSILKTLLFVLAGAMMIGHGARMMYQGLVQPHSYYPAPTPHSIDFFFDWMTLFIVGIIVLGYTLFSFYKRYDNTVHRHFHT